MIRRIESPLTGNFMASNVNYRRGISCNLNDIMDSKELSRHTKVHGQTVIVWENTKRCAYFVFFFPNFYVEL